MDAAIGDEKVMKAAAAVALGSPEKDDMYSEMAAYIARTSLPGLVLQHGAVVRSTIFSAVMHQVVFPQKRQGLIQPLPCPVVGFQSLQACLF